MPFYHRLGTDHRSDMTRIGHAPPLGNQPTSLADRSAVVASSLPPTSLVIISFVRGAPVWAESRTWRQPPGR